jgi:hypothetical protein
MNTMERELIETSPAETLRLISSFARGSGKLIRQGNRAYRTWVGFLLLLIV